MTKSLWAVALATLMCGCIRTTQSTDTATAAAAQASAAASSAAASSLSSSSTRGSSSSRSQSSSSSSSSSAGGGTSFGQCVARSSSSLSSSASSSGGVADIIQFSQAVMTARCIRDQACQLEQGPSYSSAGACEAVNDVLDALFLANLGQTFDELMAGTIVLGDATARQECLDSINNTPCQLSVPLGPCHTAMAVRDPAPIGGSCSGAAGKQCAHDAFCQSTGNGCAVCVPRSQPGARCASTEQCVTNTCVSAGDGGQICVLPDSLPGPGEACGLSCRGNLRCVAQDGGRLCQAMGVLGAACNIQGVGLPGCTADLRCAVDGGPDGTCVPGVQTGDVCQRNTTNECVCAFASPTAPTGTCNSVTAPLDDGQPCATWLFPSYTLCSDTASPHVITNDGGFAVLGCVCEAKRVDCDACTGGGQCHSGYCAGPSGNRQCRPPESMGTRCSADVDCTSRYCEPTLRICAERPACP